MPLRSVEAATRDDAIAAAREQFGPTARVVGVRRVRSGGVLGFFATERYVAEVASDSTGRPAVPASAASRSADIDDDVAPSDFSSPLASAAPARARAAAPARNGAAAWAAEAARTSRDLPASSTSLPRVTPSAADDVWPAAAPRTVAPARTGSQPVAPRPDHERVSELAGLLAGQPTAPELPAQSRARYTRAEFQRAGSVRDDAAGSRDDVVGGSGFAVAASSASAAPSPFTAALARMVAGDRDVRQAVREALDDPAAPRPRGAGDSRPIRPGALGPLDTSVASPAARQKEETVGDQVIAPSTFADQPVEVPAWAAEPEVVAPSVSSREEAIAEVLRSALAQGHSDEALAGILRKVLAGVAPQTALAEPEVPVRPAPDVVLPVDIAGAVAVPPAPEVTAPPAPVVFEPATVAEPAPVAELATVVEPVAEVQPTPVAAPAPLFPAAAPVYAPPAPLFSAPTSFFAAPAPYSPPPLFAPSVDSMWGDPSPATLWGEPVTVTVSRAKQVEAPIWAEVAQEETPVDGEADAPAADVTVEAGVTGEAEFGETGEADAPAADVTVEAEFNETGEAGAGPQAVEASVPPVVAELPAVEVTPSDLEVPATDRAEDEPAAVEAPERTAVELAAVDTASPEAAIDAQAVEALAQVSAVEAVEAAAEVPAVEVEAVEVEAVEVEAVEVEAVEVEAVEVEAVEVEAAGVEAAGVEFPAAVIPAVDVTSGSAADVTPVEESAPEAAVEAEVEASVGTVVAEQADDVVEELLDEGVADETVEATHAEIESETAEVETADENLTDANTEDVTESAAETEAAVEAETFMAAEVEELAPMLARTASDPAPMMSLDATTVMPPLSLLPPLPSSRGRGRPPVPPVSRPLTSRPSSPTATPPAPPVQEQPASPAADLEMPVETPAPGASAPRSLATVTRLPVGPLMVIPAASETPGFGSDELDDLDALTSALFAGFEAAALPEDDVPDVVLPPTAENSTSAASVDLRGRLEALGLPGHLLGESFADDAAGHGIYAALTRALGLRLPAAPELPSGAGDVLFVVGPGFETLRAARSLAVSLRLDPDSVQWATRGELAGLAGKGSRITTVETAMDRCQDAASSGTVTIVAVDAPLRTDAYWMSQMLAIWSPTAVWVVVEATRKPEDLGPWIGGLPRVDALVVTDTDLSADPAAVLRRVAAPVALIDGVRATPHRWASLLCERLESTKA